LNVKGFLAGDLDELLEEAIEGVGLWVDVDARDGLSVDVDDAGLAISYFNHT
jgi:hypothetical protein